MHYMKENIVILVIVTLVFWGIDLERRGLKEDLLEYNLGEVERNTDAYLINKIYAYMFMFCFTTSGVKHPFLWMIFTNEFFIIKCPVLLFSGIFKISLGAEKEDKIKNVITGCQITGLLTIIVFMVIYMLYTRSLFIAQGIIIGVLWLISILIDCRSEVEKSELESGETKSKRRKRIIFITVTVFILMVQMHQ